MSTRLRVTAWSIAASLGALGLLVLAGPARAGSGSFLVAGPGAHPAVVKGESFFETQVLDVENAGGIDTVLAADPKLSGDLWIDDAVDIAVTHANGSVSRLTRTFHSGGGCGNGDIVRVKSLNLNPLLSRGRNSIHITFRDVCGTKEGNSPVWLVGGGNFSAIAVASGWRQPKPIPAPTPREPELTVRRLVSCLTHLGIVTTPQLTFYGPQPDPNIPAGPYSLEQIEKFYDGASTIAGAVGVVTTDYVCGTGLVQATLQRYVPEGSRECILSFGRKCKWTDASHTGWQYVPSNGVLITPKLSTKLAHGTRYRLAVQFQHPSLSPGKRLPTASMTFDGLIYSEERTA